MKTKEKMTPIKKTALSDAAVELSDEILERVIGGIDRLDFSGGFKTSSENLQPAETTFSDADTAKEIEELIKHNMLVQTAQAMLAQANETKPNELQLLQ